MILMEKVDSWNNTVRDYPLDKTLAYFLELQVADSPESIAIYFENESITYSELNQRANKLARFLCSEGVGNDTLVGVYMERSIDGL